MLARKARGARIDYQSVGLLAIFGFRHHSDCKMKFGKCEIALHKETSIGLLVGLAAKNTKEETKKGEQTMETQSNSIKKKSDKFTWKTLVALLCMVPLVRRAT